AAAAARGVPVRDELAAAQPRVADAEGFDAAWRRYAGLGEPVRLAPFCVLAGAGEVYAERPVAWQLDVLDRLVAAAPGTLVSTDRCTVTLADPASRAAGTAWWQALVDGGGEGAVVKPAGGCVRGPKGLVQPGLKVRGPEYLRLVYGPHYREPANLERLQRRNVGAQALAGVARVRARPGGAAPVRRRRAAVAGARGGRRRARLRVGAGGSPALTLGAARRLGVATAV
ncbi:MAG: hypothetical protein QOG76_5988, partial [Pseudonocardiales bacterium]|nr:hypothetical protein [Pseudonocardiales bacterium]